MKNSLKILLLAFLGGVAGAFVFQKIISPNRVTEVVSEIPATIQTKNFEYRTAARSYIGGNDIANVDF